VSELSEHDQATLRLIEERLAAEDPRLTRLLARFGRRERSLRLPPRRWLVVGVVGFGFGCLVLASLLISFVR
jgi:hypothetical protein